MLSSLFDELFYSILAFTPAHSLFLSTHFSSVPKHVKTFDNFAPASFSRMSNPQATKNRRFTESWKISWFKVEILSIMTEQENWVFTDPPFTMKIFCTNTKRRVCCPWPTRDPTRMDASSSSVVPRQIGWMGSMWFLAKFWMEIACWRCENARLFQWVGRLLEYPFALCSVGNYNLIWLDIVSNSFFILA